MYFNRPVSVNYGGTPCNSPGSDNCLVVWQYQQIAIDQYCFKTSDKES